MEVYKVLEDKFSVKRSSSTKKDSGNIQYASEGDFVRIVSRSGHVAICEKLNRLSRHTFSCTGHRFSILKEKLQLYLENEDLTIFEK